MPATRDPRDEVEPHFSPRQRTLQRGNEEAGGVRIVLGMLSVLESQNMTRVFDHHVLEPAARAKARDVVLSGILDRPQSSLRVLVWAARKNPKALIALKKSGVDGSRGDPVRLDSTVELRRRMADRGGRFGVRRERLNSISPGSRRTMSTPSVCITFCRAKLARTRSSKLGSLGRSSIGEIGIFYFRCFLAHLHSAYDLRPVRSGFSTGRPSRPRCLIEPLHSAELTPKCLQFTMDLIEVIEIVTDSFVQKLTYLYLAELRVNSFTMQIRFAE